MPVMAVSRGVRAGCSSGWDFSCARISGEAFTSTQALLSRPHTAIEDWVRARKWRTPARTAAQLRQLQFHCGKPPPAADPRTRILTGFARSAGPPQEVPSRAGPDVPRLAGTPGPKARPQRLA